MKVRCREHTVLGYKYRWWLVVSAVQMVLVRCSCIPVHNRFGLAACHDLCYVLYADVSVYALQSYLQPRKTNSGSLPNVGWVRCRRAAYGWHGLRLWEVLANVWNKQSWTADSGWSPSYSVVGAMAANRALRNMAWCHTAERGVLH